MDTLGRWWLQVDHEGRSEGIIVDSGACALSAHHLHPWVSSVGMTTATATMAPAVPSPSVISTCSRACRYSSRCELSPSPISITSHPPPPPPQEKMQEMASSLCRLIGVDNYVTKTELVEQQAVTHSLTHSLTTAHKHPALPSPLPCLPFPSPTSSP